MNTRISQLSIVVTNNYNNALSDITTHNCKCETIELFESSKSPEIFTVITASDNIFLSMLYLRANVQIYSEAKNRTILLVSTCIGISNSITTLINTIKNQYITKIAGNNFTALTKVLEAANNGVNANIKYGDNLIKTYTDNIKKIICTITNDPTYLNTINSMNDSRKTNFITSFIDILKINVNIPKMNNQKINDFNNTILIILF
jgi:hypothetical protein